VRPRPDDSSRYSFDTHDSNYRLVVEPGTIEIDDTLAGRHAFNPFDEIGDYVVWTKRGAPAYQLAVVVDDARQGVTDVVRGDDLLSSAARQRLLYDRLDLTPPRWWHLPLVTGPDGRRLAKRHGDTRVTRYRDAGVPATRIIGLMASWCGIADEPREMTTEEFRATLDLQWFRSTPGRTQIVFRPEDETWLLGSDEATKRRSDGG
jgi:glutamyl-tRNA synthetase